MELEVHSAHSAATRHRRGRRLLLWRFGHHGFGRHQQAGDRSRILQRGAHDLGGIDDALSTKSTYSSLWASKPKVSDLCSMILPTTIEPSTPEFSAICR